MKKPEPIAGLVVRYDYLWHDEAARGREEGSKDRPCTVIIAYEQNHDGNQSVILAAITHSPPRKQSDALEIPQTVKRHLGLDAERSWIVKSEINRVDWNDAGIVPAKHDQWEYGRLPQKLWQPLRDAIIERSQRRQLEMVDRRQIEADRDQGDDRGR